METQSYMPIHSLLKDNVKFKRYGYDIFRSHDLAHYTNLQSYFTQYLHDALINFMIKNNASSDHIDQLKEDEFKLVKYHEFLKEYHIDHHAFIASISRRLPEVLCQHPYLISAIEIASDYFHHPMKIYNKSIEFRVCRPNQDDNNPLHRDHWFPYFTPLVNIYLPLAGSYFDSAMKIVPCSHTWTDEEIQPEFQYGEGKKTVKGNGVAYSVPKIRYSSREIIPHRPDIIEGDFMLFSPLLVHGGGDNFSPDTRFSFEIRLERHQ